MLLMSMFPHVYAQVFSTWCSGGAPSTRRTTSNSPTSTAFLRWTSLKMSRDRIPLVGIFSGLEGVVVDVLFNPKARFLGSRIEGGGIDSSIPKRGVWLQIAGSQPEHQLLWTTFCWQIASNLKTEIFEFWFAFAHFVGKTHLKKNILNGDEHHRFPFVKGTKSYTIPLSCNRGKWMSPLNKCNLMKWKFKTNQFVSSIPTEFQWFQPFSGEFSMNPNWRNNHNGLDPKGQLLASDNDIMAPAPAGVGFNADLVTSAAAVANKHRANSQHPWICPYRLYHIEWYGAVSVHLKWTQLQMFQIQVRSVWIERMFSSICPYHLICCTCPYFHSPCHRTKTSTQFCFWGKNDWTPSHTALRTRVSIWLVIQKCSGELVLSVVTSTRIAFRTLASYWVPIWGASVSEWWQLKTVRGSSPTDGSGVHVIHVPFIPFIFIHLGLSKSFKLLSGGQGIVFLFE